MGNLLRALALLFHVFSCVAVFSQNTWQLKSTAFASRNIDVQVDEEGMTHVLCQLYDYENYKMLGHLSKLDPEGGMVWSKQFSAENGFAYITPAGMALTSDGGTVIGGYGNHEMFLSKVNGDGEFLWSWQTQDPDTICQEIYPWNIVEAENGDLVVLGDISCLDLGYVSFLARLDASGAMVWSELISTPSFNVSAGALNLTENGDILVLCRSTQPSERLWMARFSPDGDPVLAVGYTEPVPYFLWPLAISEDGIGYHVFAKGGSLLRIETDEAGIPENTMSYTYIGEPNWFISDVVRIPGDGRLFGGAVPGLASRVLAVRLNEDGSLRWANTLYNDDQFQYHYHVAASADTAFLFAGHTAPDSLIIEWDVPWPASFVARTDGLGFSGPCSGGATFSSQPASIIATPLDLFTGPFLSWTTAEMQLSPGPGMYAICDPVSVQDERMPHDALILSPNPASDQFTLRTADAGERILDVQVFNELGQQVLLLQAADHTFGTDPVMDSSALSPGVYQVRIRTTTDMRVARLVVAH